MYYFLLVLIQLKQAGEQTFARVSPKGEGNWKVAEAGSKSLSPRRGETSLPQRSVEDKDGLESKEGRERWEDLSHICPELTQWLFGSQPPEPRPRQIARP